MLLDDCNSTWMVGGRTKKRFSSRLSRASKYEKSDGGRTGGVSLLTSRCRFMWAPEPTATFNMGPVAPKLDAMQGLAFYTALSNDALDRPYVL